VIPNSTLLLTLAIAKRAAHEILELAKIVDGRFSPDRTRNTITRLLLALIGIVVIGAIFIGIKGYVQQQQEAKPPASTSTPGIDHSTPKTVPKKTTSVKTRRARTSATDADAPGTTIPLPVADYMEKTVTSDEFAKAGAKARAAHDEVEAAKDQNNRICHYPPPLPNGTKPGDVDAVYYYNWSREYCEFVGVEAEDRRH
jgi:hypothetical protein